MAGLPPPFVYPALGLGLGQRKKAIDVNGETYVLGSLGSEGNMFSVPTVANGVVNTAIQGYFVLPGRCKIPKITVFCSAIGTVAGTTTFNIVLGTAAYTQGSIPGNDNSSVPNVSLRDSTTGLPTTIAGGAGICTNPAVAGNAFFSADVAFNATNFPNLTTGAGTGTTYAQTLIPSNPDAVWPNGAVLTLRATTVTGTITNLIISGYVEPQPLAASYPSIPNALTAIPGIPVPGQDF